MTHHVILGAGPAGVIAAETIRKHAPHDRITLVGDEAEPPYSRMAIPYVLIGNIDERGTYLRKGADHFAHLNITQVHARAVLVDAKAKGAMLHKVFTKFWTSVSKSCASTKASKISSLALSTSTRRTSINPSTGSNGWRVTSPATSTLKVWLVSPGRKVTAIGVSAGMSGAASRNESTSLAVISREKPSVTSTGIEEVEFTAAGGNVSLDASLFAGVTTVDNVGSINGSDVTVTGLAAIPPDNCD